MEQTSPYRIAVITPYHREETEVLQQCLTSVGNQTHNCVHFLIADGYPSKLCSAENIEHIVLPRAHLDNGNIARAVGSLSAMRQGFDAITYLDADNWFTADHIESLVRLHQVTKADVCTAARTIHRLDGSFMYEDRKDNDGVNHVDTSCLFLTRPTFRILPIWAMMPHQVSPICDQFVWQVIRSKGFQTAHSSKPTVAFRTQYETHYRFIGEEPPPEAKTIADSTRKALHWWESLTLQKQKQWLAHMGL